MPVVILLCVRVIFSNHVLVLAGVGWLFLGSRNDRLTRNRVGREGVIVMHGDT